MNTEVEIVTKSIQVYGKVQGVFFRASTKKEADRLGLVGWVKNRPDGSVEIEVTGNEHTIKQLVDWCHQGPLMARVERVDSSQISIKHYQDFSVAS